MRVILFQDRFAAMVKTGLKHQTIRKSARCKPGDILSLRRWSGKPYRSRQELLRTETCTAVKPILITNTGIYVDGRWCESFPHDMARADGFVDFGEMVLWFGVTHGLPFCGELIDWADITATVKETMPAGLAPGSGKKVLR